MATPSSLWIYLWARMDAGGGNLEDYTLVDFLPEKESPYGAYYLWEARALRRDPDAVLCVIYPVGANDPEEALFRFGTPAQEVADETATLPRRGVRPSEIEEFWPASYSLLSWQIAKE